MKYAWVMIVCTLMSCTYGNESTKDVVAVQEEECYADTEANTCMEIEEDTFVMVKDTLKVPFPYKLRKYLELIAIWDSCRGQEPMELTDSLRNRIRIFVEHDPNYIVYKMSNMYCFNKEMNYELNTIMKTNIYSQKMTRRCYTHICV